MNWGEGGSLPRTHARLPVFGLRRAGNAMPARLTEAQIDAFHRDGFVAPVDVMSAQEAGRLRARLETAERNHPNRLSAANRNNAHYEFRFLDGVVHDSRIHGPVADLLGPDLLLWSTVLFIKEAHTPAHVSFHQDATYMGIEPHVGITAWLALTDATVDNGCMYMERGSHLDAIREHHDTFHEDNILTRGQTIHEVDHERTVPIELRAGQMSLHHVRTVHASGANRSSDRRIGVAMQAFFPPEARQTHGHDYALLVCGQDRHHHFRPGRRPRADAEPEGMAFRQIANDRFAEILYAGAARQRDL